MSHPKSPCCLVITFCFIVGTSIVAASQAAANHGPPIAPHYAVDTSDEVQPVSADVGALVDRSVHVDILQDRLPPFTSSSDSNAPALRFIHPTSVPRPLTRATNWIPQPITSMSPAPSPPLAVESTPPPSPLPSFLPVPVISPLDPDADQTPSQQPHKVASARGRLRDEAARSKARSSQKRFHQQCATAGLTDYECRLKQKNTQTPPIDAALRREEGSTRQAHSP
jgi:hypothetical protein